ncbi:hypothetical protein Ndes2437A_g08015 [Nannochloris sp. 'desiccata']
MKFSSTTDRAGKLLRAAQVTVWFAHKMAKASKLVTPPRRGAKPTAPSTSTPAHKASSAAFCGVKMSGCFSWRPRRSHASFEFFQDDEEIAVLVQNEVLVKEALASPAPPAGVMSAWVRFDPCITVESPTKIPGSIVEEDTGSTIKALVDVSPSAAAASIDASATTSVAASTTVVDILQKCLHIPLPDNDEVVEESSVSCTQQQEEEEVSTEHATSPASALSTTPSAISNAALFAAAAHLPPASDVKERTFVMPLFPERGVVMTTAQVEAFVRAQVAAGTNTINAPLRMAPPPPLPCIIPVAGGIQFPERLVDPTAGEKILKALLAGNAPSPAPSSDASTMNATAAAKLKAAFAFNATAAEYVPTEKALRAAADASEPFKNMVRAAQLRTVGGDMAELRRQLAERRQVDERAAAKHTAAGRVTFDPEAAIKYMEDREKDLLKEVEEADTSLPGNASTAVSLAVFNGAAIGESILAMLNKGAASVSAASATTPALGEDKIYQLKAKVAELEHALEHSLAVAAAAKPRSPLELDRVAILGERNTGTNPVEHILRSNLGTEEIAVQAGLRNIKHYFQEPDDSLGRTLVLIVVRNPYDWLDSMHRSCYCCEEVSDKSLEEFLKSPFQTTPIDPVTKDTRPTEGCPLDYNPYSSRFTGGSSSGGSNKPPEKSFKNIMSARYEKFHHWVNFSRTAAGYEIVQIENLLDPSKQEEWFTSLAAKWHLPVGAQTEGGFDPLVKDARFWRVEGEENYFNVEKRVAQSIYLHSETADTLLREDAGQRRGCRLKNLYFDDFVENMMGYHRVDCEGKKEE